MIECVSVKTPANWIFFRNDRCCSWAVVQQCKLTESFTWLVDLQMSWLWMTAEYFRAVKRSTFENIHAVALVILGDHRFTWREPCFFYLVYKSLEQALSELVFGVIRLWDYFRLEIFFLVMLTIHFGRNAHFPTSFFRDYRLIIFGIRIATRFSLGLFFFIT